MGGQQGRPCGLFACGAKAVLFYFFAFIVGRGGARHPFISCLNWRVTSVICFPSSYVSVESSGIGATGGILSVRKKCIGDTRLGRLVDACLKYSSRKSSGLAIKLEDSRGEISSTLVPMSNFAFPARASIPGGDCLITKRHTLKDRIENATQNKDEQSQPQLAE